MSLAERLTDEERVLAESYLADGADCFESDGWLRSALAEIDALRAERESDRVYAAELFAEIDALRAEIARLQAERQMTMGVGHGSGRLFVHGDYDSITAARALVERMEAAETMVASLRACLAATD